MASVNFGAGTQSTVKEPFVALPGMSRQENIVRPFLNPASATNQVVTLDITGALDSTDYSVVVDSSTITAQYVAADGFAFGGIAAGTAITDTIMRDVLLYELQVSTATGRLFAEALGANQITLTNEVAGVDAVVSVAGGAELTIASAVASVLGDYVPYGVAVVLSSVDEVANIAALPSATGQSIYGFTRHGHYGGRLRDTEAALQGVPTDAIAPGEQGSAVVDADGYYARAEAAFAGTETTVYFRHTADGALTDLGVLAPAAGTGLDAITQNVSILGPSVTVEDGIMVVPVRINL